jgi:drug/metabolite transporter (DMT)-like permease
VDTGLLIGYGLIGVGGVQLLYFVATSRIPVGVAILLVYTSPVVIALWTRFVRKVPLPRLLWVGIALAMVGLALVAQVGTGARLVVCGPFSWPAVALIPRRLGVKPARCTPALQLAAWAVPRVQRS